MCVFHRLPFLKYIDLKITTNIFLYIYKKKNIRFNRSGMGNINTEVLL